LGSGSNKPVLACGSKVFDVFVVSMRCYAQRVDTTLPWKC